MEYRIIHYWIRSDKLHFGNYPDDKENEFKIFTNGSKICERTGSPYVIYHNGNEIFKEIIRLNDECPVYNAESIATSEATTFIINLKHNVFIIVSDSTSALYSIISLEDNKAYTVHIRNIIMEHKNIQLVWT